MFWQKRWYEKLTGTIQTTTTTTTTTPLNKQTSSGLSVYMLKGDFDNFKDKTVSEVLKAKLILHKHAKTTMSKYHSGGIKVTIKYKYKVKYHKIYHIFNNTKLFIKGTILRSLKR